MCFLVQIRMGTFQSKEWFTTLLKFEILLTTACHPEWNLATKSNRKESSFFIALVPNGSGRACKSYCRTELFRVLGWLLFSEFALLLRKLSYYRYAKNFWVTEPKHSKSIFWGGLFQRLHKGREARVNLPTLPGLYCAAQSPRKRPFKSMLFAVFWLSSPKLLAYISVYTYYSRHFILEQ